MRIVTKFNQLKSQKALNEVIKGFTSKNTRLYSLEKNVDL